MLVSFLNKPYPYLGDFKRNLVVNFFIGCFIAFFLVIFQPFNINRWDTPGKTIKLLGFGFVSFAVPVILGLLVNTVFKRKTLEDNWKIWSEILNIIIVLLCIAFGNLLYGNLLGAMTLSVSNYFSAVATVLLIGIFPVTLHVITKHNKLLKLNFQNAERVNSNLKAATAESFTTETIQPNLPQLNLVAENERDKIILDAAQLLFIESADNYSNIVYTETGAVKKQLIRSSLKRMEQQVLNPAIIRCHRAYIVNLENVEKIEGNAAGYRLYLKNCREVIPVSRSYSARVLELLDNKQPLVHP